MEPQSNETKTTTDTTTTTQPQTTSTDIQSDTIMGVLCYLGPLVIVPYITSLSNPFVKFHIKQGLILFGIEIAIYVVSTMFMYSAFMSLFPLLNLGTLILAIIGIINVVGKKETALPLIGQFADKIKI